nr:reverse transcriptase domain-containing protein [Tanacetum cinerariifolium]
LHQIDTFYNALTQSDQDSLNAATGGNLLNRTPRDALTIIENKSKVRISRNKPIVSKVNTTTFSPSPSSDVTSLTEIVKELILMNKATQQATIKSIEETCVTCGGPHPYYECLATGGNTFDACVVVGTYNQGGNDNRPQGDLNYRASNQIETPSFPPPNVQNNQNYNQNRGVSYEGPSIPPTSSSLSKEVKREPEVTKDKVQTTNSRSTAHVQPLIVQILILEPEVVPKPNPKPSIPYPSRPNNQKLQKKTNNQMLKFFQIFQRLHFDLSLADALLHMPKFASTFKSLLSNKEKLFELVKFGFKRAFATLFGQDIETFTGTMFIYVEQLEKQLDKEDFQKIGYMDAFNVLETQFQMFIMSRIYLIDKYVAMTRSYFQQYTKLLIPEFHDTLIQHMESVKKSIDERAHHKRDLADIESSGTESKEQDTSSRLGNDAHDDDAYIRPIYDEEPMDEVQTTAEINIFAIEQQHAE